MELQLQWLTENFLYRIVLISLVIDFLLDLYINYRQNKVLVNVRYRDLPSELQAYYSSEVFERARRYEISNNKYDLCVILNILIKNAAYLYFLYYVKMWKYSKILLSATGLWPSNWDEELGTTMCYYFIATVLREFTNFPFYFYRRFMMEGQSFGFKRGIVYILRSMKNVTFGLMISNLMYNPGATLLVLIVKNTGKYFFVFVWLHRLFSDISFSYFFPNIINPMLNDYAQLNESPLRTRLEKLVDEIEFPLSKIYIRFSETSDNANAYFDGVFTNKRIVLYNSMIKDLDNDNLGSKSNEEKIEEIAATVAHELGHWNGLHTLQLFFCNQFKTIFVVSIFALLYQHAPMFQAFGFRKGEIPVYIAYEILQDYILIPYHLLTNVLDSLLSRKFEREADVFAVKLGLATPFKSGLCKDNAENLNFPFQDPLYQFCHGSHPTLTERIDNIDQAMKKLQ